MSKTKILLTTLLLVSAAICGVVLYEGYKEFQNKNTITTLNKAKSDLNAGNYKEAQSLLNSINSNNLFGKSLYKQEETAINTFKLNSDSYNQALVDMNSSKFDLALNTLNSIKTTNSYLKPKVTSAIDYCNINYTKQLYNEGLEALKNKDASGVKEVYSRMNTLYPNSAFTKQLYDYMTGKAKATTSSFNIKISNPNSSGFTPINLDNGNTSSSGGVGSSSVTEQQSTQQVSQPASTTTTTTTTTQSNSEPVVTTKPSTSNSTTTYINNAKKDISSAISTTYSSSQQQQQNVARSQQSQQDTTTYQKSCNEVDSGTKGLGGLTSTSYSSN